jgi:PiT family inorganic phosphate transporter
MQRFERAAFHEKGSLLESLPPAEQVGMDQKERKTLQKLYRRALVERSTLIRILSAWILTLPASGLLAAFIYMLLERFGN